MPDGNAFAVGDVHHAIVKKGGRNSVAIDLSERLVFVEESRDGRLEGWYW